MNEKENIARQLWEKVKKNPEFRKNQYRALKLSLMKEFGVCWYCGITVKDYGRMPDGERHPDDEATIDHTVSRFFRKKGDDVLKVLACNKCNGTRALQENVRYLKDYKIKNGFI